MKKTKWFLAGLIMALCLILHGEIRQYTLSEFRETFYCLDLRSQTENLTSDLQTVSDSFRKEGIGIFALQKEAASPFEHAVAIYADDFTRSLLSRDGIEEGKYSSLFSGSTTVSFQALSFLQGNGNDTVQRVTLYCTTDDIELLDTARRRLMAETGTEVTTVYGYTMFWLKYLPYGIELLGLLFLLFLTFVDVESGKKENFILISLGKTKERIFLEGILMDLLAEGSLFFLLAAAAEHGMNLFFPSFAVWVLILFFLLNSLLYLPVFSYKQKEILYGENLDIAVLADCYVLKVITMIVCIFALSFGFLRGFDYLHTGRALDLLADLDDWSFVTVNAEDDPETRFAANTQWVREQYEGHNVGISLPCFGIFPEENLFGILISDTMSSLISDQSVLEHLDDSDVHILVPSNFPKEHLEEYISMAIAMPDNLFGIPSDALSYETVFYDQEVDVICFDASDSVSNGYRMNGDQDIIHSPVIAFLTLSKKAAAMIGMEHAVDSGMDTMIFRLAQESSGETTLRIKAENTAVHYQAMSVMAKRLMLTCIIISVLSLLMEAAIIMTCVRLEYTVNARILALKKIFGWSILRKNSGIFLSMMIGSLIAVFVVTILNSLMDGMDSDITGFVTWALMALEATFTSLLIYRTEQERTAKILKGGSL